jgi:heme exporter protein C
MHRFANPARFLRIARPLTLPLLIAGALLIAAGCYAGLFVTPPDYQQGDTVRILYIHVPAASLMQLIWKHPLAGVAGRAIALPGALFTAICLASGSIWGRPTWGTWWQWDGRMTSMLVLLFLYIAYIALADAGEERTTVSPATAIFGVVGAINLPIIKYSVTWWNSLHQPPSIGLNGSAIAPELLWPLGPTTLGFSLLFGAIVLMRMRAILGNAKREARLERMARA